MACYNNNLSLVELYLNYLNSQFKNTQITKESITLWINFQNDEGFTALHLASYRGNLVIILLIGIGNNYNSRKIGSWSSH